MSELLYDRSIDVIRFDNIPWHRCIFDDEVNVPVIHVDDLDTLLSVVILKALEAGNVEDAKIEIQKVLTTLRTAGCTI